MKFNYKLLIIIFILISVFLAGCNRDINDEINIKLNGHDIKIKGSDSVEFENGIITITDGGIYRFTGTGENIQIFVDTNDAVDLILDDVQITNERISGIKIESDYLVAIHSVGDKPNVIKLTGDDCKQCIKADGVLSIVGQTELILEGLNGIKADNLDFVNANVYFSQRDTAIKAKEIRIFESNISIDNSGNNEVGIYAKELIEITNSNIYIDTGNDCIHSEDKITIDGGTLDLKTGDDAIHSKNNITILSGTISITKCLEGIESKNIDIFGGSINIKSDNDGINAVRENENKISTITINGGEIIIDADGDGLDANGDIIINGGILVVSGANGGNNNAIDFDSEFIINGGAVFAAGNSKDSKQPSDKSMQNVVMIEYQDKQSADKGLALVDNNGNVIFATQLFKSYDLLIISLPQLKLNSEYYLGVTSSVEEYYMYDSSNNIIEFQPKSNSHFTINQKILLIYQ